MKRTRQAEVVVDTVVYEIVCDGCGKVAKIDPPTKWADPDGWLSFSSGHNEWAGSDESYDNHDACSFACFVKIVHEIVDSFPPGDYPTLHVTGSSWDATFLGSMLAHNGSLTRRGTPEADASAEKGSS